VNRARENDVRAKRVLSIFAYGSIEGELQHSSSVRKGSRVIRVRRSSVPKDDRGHPT
jgi:hypothetical protein